MAAGVGVVSGWWCEGTKVKAAAVTSADMSSEGLQG